MKEEFLSALKIENKELFKARVFQAIEEEKMQRKSFSIKKSIAIGIPVLAIPLTVYAATSLIWGGQHFDFSKQNAGPLSQIANPSDPFQELNGPGVKTYDLTNSRDIANFMIRQPHDVAGWNEVVSEGIVAPQSNYVVDPKTQQKTLVSVTETPLRYVDIYTNNKGQRIAVTQEYDSNGTQDLQAAARGTQNNGSGWILGKNAVRLEGFDPSIGFLISGNWSENPSPVPFKGNFENLLILHQESNQTVTKFVIDEYGDVAPTVLESIAHLYLGSPSQ